MHANNDNLHRAKAQKNDEFYTRYEDVERELIHYTQYFTGKIVYCNCDSKKSSFYRYFKDNFTELGLKKLVCTHYSENNPYKIELEQGNETITPLNGNGDFRSTECLDILDSCDIVVTNPPFSLFREFVKTLMDKDKKFLIIGSLNAITYKEIFPYIKSDKLWLGTTHVTTFIQPDGTPKKFGNILWYTNLDHQVRHKELVLTKKYHSDEYHRYDNYEALHINSVKDIPSNYLGVMAVPITYLEHHNPVDYEILGDTRYHDDKDIADDINYLDGKLTFRRVLIRRIEHNQNYPRYENHDAIEVGHVRDIPKDYTDTMGVPLTYLEKHNPHQYELVGYCASHGKEVRYIPNEAPYLNGKWLYNRLLIRKVEHNQNYPHYDNYDGINVDKISDVPEDYNGVIGVPITYLEKHNPDQFEIIGLMSGSKGGGQA